MTFHERLRSRRLSRGLSQEALAALVGTTNAYISHWELGYRAPTLDQIARLEAALGVRRGFFGAPEVSHPRRRDPGVLAPCGTCSRSIPATSPARPILPDDFCRHCGGPLTAAGEALCPIDGFVAAVRALTRRELDPAETL